MITDIKVGDITSPKNSRDIIIGMNTELDDVTGIGLPFVKKISVAHPINLGSVLSFTHESDRNVHMIVCHHLRDGGWKGAEQFVRFGLDFLWHTDPDRKYSIVQVGTGRVGKRYGADSGAIHTAIASSFLPVHLFVLDPDERVNAHGAVSTLHPYRHWTPVHGSEDIRIAV